MGTAGSDRRPGSISAPRWMRDCARRISRGLSNSDRALQRPRSVEIKSRVARGRSRPLHGTQAVRRKARSLDIDAVLVGPEPRRLAVGLAFTHHRAPDGDTVVLGVLHRLQQQALVALRMPEGRNITGREDIRRARSAERVDDDAALDRDPGRRRKLGVPLHPDARDDAVAVQPDAIAADDHYSGLGALDRGHARSEAEHHPGAFVQGADLRGGRFGKRPRHHAVGRFDHGNIASEGACAGGAFEYQ